MDWRIVEPVDLLFLRGNRLFGGSGEHGDIQVAPWPSVFAGAMASFALSITDRLPKISQMPEKAEQILEECLGEDYALTFLGIQKGERVYLELPKDLIVFRDEKDNGLEIKKVLPSRIPRQVKASMTTPMLPVFKSGTRKKPETGFWLDLAGWREHLKGQTPGPESLIHRRDLWGVDWRLGIARDFDSRTAEEAMIYTTETLSLTFNTSFVVGFSGKGIPKQGILRLGGDGRGASFRKLSDPGPLCELGRPFQNWKGFRMILTTPGIFPDGWLPPGTAEQNGKVIFSYRELEAELICASIPRHEVISGWDLARHVPKPASKVVPAGSVYWFRVIDGDTSELEVIWKNSLYSADFNLSEEFSRMRRREGFGRAWFGYWNPDKEVQPCMKSKC